MSDTSIIFNLLAKDNASQAFNQLRLNATRAFDFIATRAFDFAKESVAAFEEAERGQTLLEDAFAKFPALADTNVERLRKLNSALEMTTTFDDDVIATGQAKLAMFNFTGKQIEALTPLMLDFASKTGGDLATAATTFGKAMIGQGRGLKQVGINFKDTGSAAGNYAELIDQLGQKVGGFAEKEGKTAAGQTKILSNQFGELKEKIGGALVPVLLKLIPPVLQLLDFFQRHINTMVKVLAVVGSIIGIIWLLNAAVRAYTAVQIALNIAMSLNPIGLIIIAVIALVAAFVYLWMHSAKFREFFINIWNHIWGFLKAVGAWFAGPFVNFFKAAGNRISEVAKDIAAPFVWLWQHVLYPGFSFANRIITSFMNLFTAMGITVIKPIIGIIKAEIHGWAVVFGWLYDNILTPIGHGIMATLHAIGAGWSWLYDNAIGPAIHAIADAVQWAWGWLSQRFDWIMAKVKAVGDFFGSVFGAIGGFVSSAFDNAVAFFKLGINTIIGLMNAAAGFINRDIIDRANSVPGVNFPHLGMVPKLDVGGSILQTGIAVVHKGETVVPANRRGGGNGGGPTEITFGGNVDSAFATAFMKLVRSGDITIARKALV